MHARATQAPTHQLSRHQLGQHRLSKCKLKQHTLKQLKLMLINQLMCTPGRVKTTTLLAANQCHWCQALRMRCFWWALCNVRPRRCRLCLRALHQRHCCRILPSSCCLQRGPSKLCNDAAWLLDSGEQPALQHDTGHSAVRHVSVQQCSSR